MKKMFKNIATALTLGFLASTLIGCGDSLNNSDTRKMSEKSHRMSNTNPNINKNQLRESNTDPFIDRSQRRESNTDPFIDQ